MKKILFILVFLCAASARADDGILELALGGKAGAYQTSGNLFAEKDVRGWGLALRLIPDDFDKPGFNWLLTFDLDRLSGQSHKRALFPFSSEDEIQLTWSVMSLNICFGTNYGLSFCIGLPFSSSLYIEQNVGGQSFNSFSMSNSNPPVFLNIVLPKKPWIFGFQGGSSYWNPTFAGEKTHFNLIQAQIFAGYVL